MVGEEVRENYFPLGGTGGSRSFWMRSLYMKGIGTFFLTHQSLLGFCFLKRASLATPLPEGSTVYLLTLPLFVITFIIL